MAVKEELTGNIRCRIQTRWFGAPMMVIQVEVRCHGDYLDNAGGRIEGVPVDNTFFRDATLEDITLMELPL